MRHFSPSHRQGNQGWVLQALWGRVAQEGPCPLSSTNDDPGLGSPGPQTYLAAVSTLPDTEGQADSSRVPVQGHEAVQVNLTPVMSPPSRGVLCPGPACQLLLTGGRHAGLGAGDWQPRWNQGWAKDQLDTPTVPVGLNHGLLNWKMELRAHVSKGCYTVHERREVWVQPASPPLFRVQSLQMHMCYSGVEELLTKNLCLRAPKEHGHACHCSHPPRRSLKDK